MASGISARIGGGCDRSEDIGTERATGLSPADIAALRRSTIADAEVAVLLVAPLRPADLPDPAHRPALL